MSHHAVLFDLDGTLLNTLEDLAESANSVLAAHGFPVHPIPAYRLFVGEGVRTLLERALPRSARGDSNLVSICAREMGEEYSRRWSLKTRPYPGISELLQRLSELGVKRAVLSNKPNAFVAEMLEHYFPGLQFDAAFGERAGIPRKPDPAGCKEIASLLGIPPEGFLYLGDSDTDMATARAAGMFPVGALWGFRTQEELLAAGAREVIRAPLNLIELL